jgi:hypothetical protein
MLETQGSNISNMHTQKLESRGWAGYVMCCDDDQLPLIILCLFNSLLNCARQLSEECKSLWTTKAYIFSLLLNVQLVLLLLNLCIKIPSVAWPHRGPLVIELLVPELRVAESSEGKTLIGPKTQVFLGLLSLALMFYLNKIW